jgi:tetratricopeptide (TPR) repeat protein
MRAFAALTILLNAVPVCGADWIALRTPRIEVLTDAGERTARQALTRLEQIGQVLPAGSPQGPLRLRVFLFGSQREFLNFVPSRNIAGFYQSGLERDYIAAHAGEGLSRVVVHEYVHFVLNQGKTRLPSWFEEGLAEFYSNVEFQGSRLRIGAPIDSHLALLSRERWLDASRLLAEVRIEPGTLFYAQTWALAHMLNLSPKYRDGMPRVAAALADQDDAAAAFEAAFGRSLEAALTDLQGYVGSGLRSTAVDAPRSTEAVAPAVQVLSQLDSQLQRAELALRCRRVDTARPLFEEARREHPDSAVAEAGLGALAAAEGRPAEARAHLERALQLDDRDAAAWFQFALVEQDDGADASRVAEHLKRVVALNPDFGEAHARLGIRATDDGELSAAIAHLRQAVRLLPRESYVWHALAFAEQKAGDVAAARKSSQQALRTASSLEQVRMAEAMLQSLQ